MLEKYMRIIAKLKGVLYLCNAQFKKFVYLRGVNGYFRTRQHKTMPTLDLTNRKTLEALEKLPKPTNDNLRQLFADIDSIVIKESGVYNDKAMSNKVVLTLTEQDKVKRFSELLEIDESNTGFYCMCLGTYAIELYSNEKLKATVGFHHGVSIRYSMWNGDAELALSDQLLEFLNEQGLTKPLQDRLDEKRDMEADRIAEREWLEIAPKCFTTYWTQINSFDQNYFPSLITDINTEIPNRKEQIIILLQTFGKTENFWTAYPSYEELPNKVLKTFDTKEIIETYLSSDRNYKTRKGLGRFLCSFEFKKTRKKHLEFITDEVISDLEKCFNRLGKKRGINEIFNLRYEKNNN